MIKVKTFLHIFINSLLPQGAYLHKLLRTSFSLSLKYFIFLVFVLCFLFVTFLSFKLSPLRINAVLNNLIDNLDKYPNNLVININNGILLTNYDRPYFLWLDSIDTGLNNLILVIDQTANPQKINEYDSAILLTAKEVVYKNMRNNQDLRILPMKLVDNETITKNTINNVKSTIIKIRNLVFVTYPLIFVLLILLITIISFIANLVYAFIASGIIYIIFHIFLYKRRIKPNFKKTFQISLHSITLPLLTNYSLAIFNLRSSNILPVLYFILVIIFSAIGVHEAYSYKEHYHNIPHHKK